MGRHRDLGEDLVRDNDLVGMDHESARAAKLACPGCRRSEACGVMDVSGEPGKDLIHASGQAGEDRMTDDVELFETAFRPAKVERAARVSIGAQTRSARAATDAGRGGT